MNQPIINSIQSAKPWVLVVGRKRQIIKESLAIEMKQEVQEAYSWESPAPVAMVPTSQTVQFFIGGKLFSTAIIAPKRRYSRYAFKIVKPKRKRLEVHMTKKLMRFAA